MVYAWNGQDRACRSTLASHTRRLQMQRRGWRAVGRIGVDAGGRCAVAGERQAQLFRARCAGLEALQSGLIRCQRLQPPVPVRRTGAQPQHAQATRVIAQHDGLTGKINGDQGGNRRIAWAAVCLGDVTGCLGKDPTRDGQHQEHGNGKVHDARRSRPVNGSGKAACSARCRRQPKLPFLQASRVLGLDRATEPFGPDLRILSRANGPSRAWTSIPLQSPIGHWRSSKDRSDTPCTGDPLQIPHPLSPVNRFTKANAGAHANPRATPSLYPAASAPHRRAGTPGRTRTLATRRPQQWTLKP